MNLNARPISEPSAVLKVIERWVVLGRPLSIKLYTLSPTSSDLRIRFVSLIPATSGR